MLKRTERKDTKTPGENKMMKGFLQATKYLNSHLNPGEFPIYRAHLSWIPVFIAQIPFMLAGGIVAGIVWGVTNDFMIGLLVLCGIFLIGVLSQIPAVYRNISTDILITNQGIHSKRKLFAVEDDQFTRFSYINDAELNYDSIFQRIFEYGHIEIMTISGEQNYDFNNLAKPLTFKNAVRAAQQRYGGNAMPMQGVGNYQRPYPPANTGRRASRNNGRRAAMGSAR